MERSAAPNIVCQISDLSVIYGTYKGNITALNRINLGIDRSEIIAIVGESGCGKSTLGLALIRLLQSPPASVKSGEIQFDEKNILNLEESEMARIRGTGISMIFQDPMSSLNPVFSVGQQMMQSIDVREGRKRSKNYGPFKATENSELDKGSMAKLVSLNLPKTSRKRAYAEECIETLKRVQIADPERVLDKYPHELSGGMAQRVMIAQALLEKPTILIADEPTSALDVTTQAQVLSLMRQLRDDIGSSILFITHDLAVAAEVADRVVVMYAGEIVESAEVNKIFEKQLHPYTEGLVNCFPTKFKNEGKLEAISGEFPDLRNPPSGCYFHPRCKYVMQKCKENHPELRPVEDHEVACFLRY